MVIVAIETEGRLGMVVWDEERPWLCLYSCQVLHLIHIRFDS